ncbi:TetR/AcrR family transcriptional regulator [Streptomyces sp. NPDC051907]|uniref:TetR/AcrR family transcriptional regulator n=1 Tax=Streptomyces sp. NPDC051907 TaxID=3155284 RepID=UPI00342CC426
MTPPTSKKRRAPAMSPQERREMIVRATIPLVIEHGSAVTTRQIAQAAGIGEGTIFRVFADKDELLDACAVEAMSPGNSLAEIAAIDLDQPLADRLAQAAEAMRAHLARIGAVMGALHATGGRARTEGREHPGPDGSVPDRQTGVAAARDALAELFEPERDTLRLPPQRLALLFFGLLFTSTADTGTDADAVGAPGGLGHNREIAELVDVFLHGAVTTAD